MSGPTAPPGRAAAAARRAGASPRSRGATANTTALRRGGTRRAARAAAWTSSFAGRQVRGRPRVTTGGGRCVTPPRSGVTTSCTAPTAATRGTAPCASRAPSTATATGQCTCGSPRRRRFVGVPSASPLSCPQVRVRELALRRTGGLQGRHGRAQLHRHPPSQGHHRGNSGQPRLRAAAGHRHGLHLQTVLAALPGIQVCTDPRCFNASVSVATPRPGFLLSQIVSHGVVGAVASQTRQHVRGAHTAF